MATPVLDSLLAQKATLEQQISNANSRYNSYINSASDWWLSAENWKSLWLEDKDNVWRKQRAHDRYLKYQYALERYGYYKALANEQDDIRTMAQTTLDIVNQSIENYYNAHAEAISIGITEGGSLQIAEQIAASLAEESEATVRMLEGEAEQSKSAKGAIILLVSIGALIAAYLIFKQIKKRKSKK